MALPTSAQVLSGGYTLLGKPSLIVPSSTGSTVAASFAATFLGQPNLIFPAAPAVDPTASTAASRFFLMF